MLKVVLVKGEYFRYLNETFTTCTAILNTIDSRLINNPKRDSSYIKN